MKPADFPKAYHELYAAHQAFLKLGFKSDDLFVSLANIINIGRNVLSLRLRTQGKEFVFTVAQMGEDAVESEVLNTWVEFATLATDSEKTTTEELDDLLDNTMIFKDGFAMLGQLVGALAKKGFSVPNLPSAEVLSPLAPPTPGEVKGGQA